MDDGQQGFFYDAGKVTDLRSPDLELNRKTRLHMLGTKVSSTGHLQQRKQCRIEYRRQGITQGIHK